MATSPRNAVFAALATTVLGVLLIGAPGSFAKLSASAAGTPLVIKSGTISASVTGPTTATVATGTAPSGVVLGPTTSGIVPGVRDQTLTYTVKNSATSASSAALSSVQVLSSSIASTSAWTQLQPYLVVSVAVNGGTAVTLPSSAITSTGISATLTTSTNIQPGSTASVVITFDLPATASGGTIDLARTLQPINSIASIVVLAPVFTLTQSPKAAS